MYYDIALVKLKPIDFVIGKTSPIGLPDRKYNEIGKYAYVAGRGAVYQKSWHTNGDGPEPYTECAPGVKFMNAPGKVDEWNQWEHGCEPNRPPSNYEIDGKDSPCIHFNYQHKDKVQTSSNLYKCVKQV